MSEIKKWIASREWAAVGLLVVAFVLIRLPAVHHPLHQDEYKWPMIVNPANQSDTTIPHPPLSEFIYRTAGYIVGFNTNFRFVPLFFGTLNLLLLYYLVRSLFGKREAIISGFIWAFSYFSVLASLMVDTDGEVMPFFFLLSLIGYFKWKEGGEKKYWWTGLLVLSVALGFLVKVSFLLVPAAIAADFLWSKRHLLSRKDYILYGSYGLGALVILALLLVIMRYIFPFFDLSGSIKYWEHFANFHRNWFQTAIQCVKALLYSSPFLVFVPMLGKKEDYSKTKVFVFFLVFAFIFYVILFDFSLGALDRYLQLLILPLTVFSAVVLSNILKEENNRRREFVLLGIIIAGVLLLLQSVPHYVPPLYPKTEWVHRMLSLKWNFLYPFSGGSGPLGFYISFLFMAFCWIVSFGLAAYSIIKPQYKKLLIIIMLAVGIVYNGMFIEEYLFGRVNGSAPKLLSDVVAYIKNNPDIKMVTVYNDNGGNEIREIGKYRKRLYIDPKFDINEKIVSLNQYKEHYLVINIPRIDPSTVYQKYLDSCTVVYNRTDKSISALVYDCTKAPDIKI